MHVWILTGGTLPVPAVNGGAIETRVNYLVDENERNGLWDLKIVSCFNVEAEKEGRKYKNTEFYYLKNSRKVIALSRLWNKLVRKICRGKSIQNRMLWYPFLSKTLRKMKCSDIDVIILENKPEWVCKISRKMNKPLFLHLGNDHLNTHTENAELIVEEVAGIMTVSDYISECVSKIPGVDISKIHKVQQGIDQKLFHQESYIDSEKQQLRDQFHIKKGDIVFCFAGRIEPEKGVLETVQAFGNFEEKNVKLLIAGDVSVWNPHRDYYEKVRKEAEKNKGKVIFTGYIPHDLLGKLYSIVDIVVLPSLWNEPSGNAMIECMVAGMPLITTNRGGIPEYCPEGSAVLLPVTPHLIDDLYKAMYELYSNPNKRVELGQAAKKIGKIYTTKTHYLQIDAFIRSKNDL